VDLKIQLTTAVDQLWQPRGLVLWEYTGTLDEADAGKILDDVTNVLRGRGGCLSQEPRS
jgi:hypothetical protein